VAQTAIIKSTGRIGARVAQNRTREKKSGHISDEDIAAFVSGSLSSHWRESVFNHLATCARCRKIASGAAASQKAVKDPVKCRRRRAK
jgi:ribosomal protein L37AE/L43A